MMSFIGSVCYLYRQCLLLAGLEALRCVWLLLVRSTWPLFLYFSPESSPVLQAEQTGWAGCGGD